MSQARGFLSTLGLDFETTFGADPGTPDVKTLPFNSCDVKSSRAKNTAQTITGTRNPVEPYDGNTTLNGPIVVPVDAVAFGWWLKAMFGAPTTTGAGPYVHAFKVGTVQPSMVLEKKFASPSGAFAYAKMNGCKVAKCSMKFGGDGELTASLDIEGASETVSGSALDASPTVVSLTDRFSNFQAVIKEGGSTLGYATDFSFDLNFNLDTGVYTIGAGGVRGDLPEGIMGVTGNMTVLFQDTTLLTKAMNSTETSLEVDLTNGSSLLKFYFDEVQLQRNTPGISGSQGVKLELPWVAYYGNDSDASAVRVQLTNTQSSY